MTTRSLDLIVAADVIVHDRLIPQDALALARPDAELIYVGKEPGAASVPGGDRGAVDRSPARGGSSSAQGRRSVRLRPRRRGGGGARRSRNPLRVVPGITAGIAAPAYAGIPVTHRDDASAVAFITGHEDPEKDDPALDYEALARFPGTLVFYMGVKGTGRRSRRA